MSLCVAVGFDITMPTNRPALATASAVCSAMRAYTGAHEFPPFPSPALAGGTLRTSVCVFLDSCKVCVRVFRPDMEKRFQIPDKRSTEVSVRCKKAANKILRWVPEPLSSANPELMGFTPFDTCTNIYKRLLLRLIRLHQLA